MIVVHLNLHFSSFFFSTNNTIGTFRNNIRTVVDVGTMFSSTVVVGLPASPASEPDLRPISPQPFSLLEEKADC